MARILNSSITIKTCSCSFVVSPIKSSLLNAENMILLQEVTYSKILLKNNLRVFEKNKKDILGNDHKVI